METGFNLAEQLAIAKIESILDDYPQYPYQQAFAVPQLRQELIAYVFSRLKANSTIDPEQISWLNYDGCCLGLEQRLYVEVLTHQGIDALLPAKYMVSPQYFQDVS